MKFVALQQVEVSGWPACTRCAPGFWSDFSNPGGSCKSAKKGATNSFITSAGEPPRSPPPQGGSRPRHPRQDLARCRNLSRRFPALAQPL